MTSWGSGVGRSFGRRNATVAMAGHLVTPPTAQDERARVIPEYRQAPAKVEPADAQARALSVGIIAATAARLRITYRSHGAGTVQWRALQLG